MKKMKRLSALLVVLVLIVGLFSGCGAVAAGHITVNGKKIGIDYAMKINNYEVSMAEYRYYFLNLKTNYFDNGDDTYWDTYPDAESSLLDYTKNYIISTYASQILAESYGLSLDADDNLTVASYLQSYVQSAGSEEALEEEMAEQYISMDLFKLLLNQSALQQKLNTYLFGDGGTMATPEEDQPQVIRDNFVHVKHILVSDEDTAEEVLGKINAGEDFDALIDEYNQDTGETSDGYTFMKGEGYAQEFEDASFALDVGQISGVVESDYGYHIIERLDITDDYLTDNQEDLMDTYNSQLLYDLLDDVSAGVSVQYNRYYDQFGVNTILDDGLDNVSTADSSNPVIAFLGALTTSMIVSFIVSCALFTALMIISLWFIFKKSGEKPWASVVPFYDMFCLFRISWGNGWFFWLAIIPGVNIVVGAITMYKLSKTFGHGVGWFFGLWLLPVVFYPMLAFGGSRYLGLHPETAPQNAENYEEEILDDDEEDADADYGTYEPDESVSEDEEDNSSGDYGDYEPDESVEDGEETSSDQIDENK